MGIGAGIFLLAVGAILTFAVHTSVNGFSISTIGVILMAAGAVGLLLDLFLFAPRRRSVTTTTNGYPAGYAAAPATTTYRDEVV